MEMTPQSFPMTRSLRCVKLFIFLTTIMQAQKR